MWREIILIAGLALAMTQAMPGPAHASDQPEPISYDVSAIGFRVGTLQMSSHQDAHQYSVEARFRTTGLTRLLRRMGFVMTASGRRAGAGLMPLQYSEKVNTGQRSSSARMAYVNGVPVLSGGKVSDGETPVLDPAGQGGTIDPLSALYLVLRDQPAAGLCRIDQPMFDGARRSRIRLAGRETGAGTIHCNGYFQRVAGYSAADLANRKKVAFRVSYKPGPDGMMQAQEVTLQTSYGLIALKRR